MTDTPPLKKTGHISLVIIGLSLGVVLVALVRWGIVYTHSLGLDADGRHDYERARSLWRITAALGYTPSKATLGTSYLIGKGGPPDPVLAGKYLGAAAEDGDVDAQSTYGMALYAGAGLPLDRQRGIHWLRTAATNGDQKARNFL